MCQRFPEGSGNRIEPARAAPWVTTQEPLERHQTTAPRTVALDCLLGVSGTARFKATIPTEDRGEKETVRAEKGRYRRSDRSIAG